MYNKIRAFVAPRDKVLYKSWNPFTRVEVVFTKRDIMIYDYINCRYLGIYDVEYDIETINISLFLDTMEEICKCCPTSLYHVKYYQYISDNYTSAYDKIHC